MARAAVLLAPGFEEIEAVTVIDVLRRGGVEVLALATAEPAPTGSHGITVQADGLLADHAHDAFDVVVLPGGMPGAAHLRDDEAVQALLRGRVEAGEPMAAICAAPIALGSAGALQGRAATCYPGFEEQLTGASPRTEPVVKDGVVTTSRSPGTAIAFALALVAQLVDQAKADELAAGMLVEAPILEG